MSFKRLFYTFIIVFIGFSKTYAPSSDFKAKKVNNYERVISFVKQHEGFSAKVYNDNGYKAIGYGCRLIFTNYKGETITELQADSLLRIVFEQNKRYVLHYFSDSIKSNNQLLALTHLSYCIGIGQVLKQYRKFGFNKVLTRNYGQDGLLRAFENQLFNESDIFLTKYYNLDKQKK